MLQTLGIIIITAIVTAVVTMFVVRDRSMERFAALLWERCPQLILQPHNDPAFIGFLDGGYVPIRPRPKKQ